jgi:hypothetical protein
MLKWREQRYALGLEIALVEQWSYWEGRSDEAFDR